MIRILHRLTGSQPFSFKLPPPTAAHLNLARTAQALPTRLGSLEA
jgi:hypothetical protein